MTEQQGIIHISGAGPAGLAAAITCAQAGVKVVVHERKKVVGARFHGDFQGQENWTDEMDLLDDFSRMGIKPDFPHTACHELIAFNPNGQEFRFTSEAPLFYLVRRGCGKESFDSALLSQAKACGVEIRFKDTMKKLPDGGICAEGPRAGDVIVAGYQCETDMADGAFAALSDDLAPKGYAYLLIHEGNATLASCMFDDFHNERRYLQNTADFFQQKLGFSIKKDSKRFGGIGNISWPKTACKGNILYVGEAAGFQDALWGFGMRYAVTSGHLAAKAWLQGNPQNYDTMWQHCLGAKMQAGIVNRYIYSKFGNVGYTRFLRRLEASGDVRSWLMKHHQKHWTSRLLFPLARRALPTQRREFQCAHLGCTCTWCKCAHRHLAMD